MKNSKRLFDIDVIMNKLKDERKVFHSEDDLKFSLATIIQQQYPNAKVRLERPMKIAMVKKADVSKKIEKTISIDITVFLEHDIFFLELKYKTKELSKDFEKKLVKYMDKDDEYELKDQGACDIGRFLFRKDIYRLEKVIEKDSEGEGDEDKKGLCKGFLIVITNDFGYTENISEKEVLNKKYSFHNQEELAADDPGWNYKQKDGTFACDVKHPNKGDKHWTCKSDRAFKLDLKENNKYKVEWKLYFPEGKKNETETKTKTEKKEAFRYCIVEVNR